MPGIQISEPEAARSINKSLYINVEDIDARARKAGATSIEEPADTAYGHRRYGAEDPEGHQWYFAHEILSQKAKRKTR